MLDGGALVPLVWLTASAAIAVPNQDDVYRLVEHERRHI
jgi:hypothetical protein